MPNPVGVTVTTSLTAPPRGLPTATDPLFLVAVTDVGTPGTVEEVHNLAEFEAKFATRTAGNIALWDYLDFFFREGGRRAYVSPITTGAGLTAGLTAFNADMGPGQVAGVGLATTDHGALTADAQAKNRFALLDPLSDDDVSEAKVHGDALAATATEEFGMLCYPWVKGPGPVGVQGVGERQCPPSAVIAGLIARVDQSGNPNQAAAGRSYPLQYVTDFTTTVLRSQFADLLDHAVNPLADVYGVLQAYGFQTGAVQAAENPFWQANCSRMRMALVAQAKAIGENYMFKPIDGKGLLANALKGDLDAMLLGYYGLNALYGEEPEDAFLSTVGAVINPPESIAQGTLKASCQVVLTLHAKSVQIELVSVPVGGQLAV